MIRRGRRTPEAQRVCVPRHATKRSQAQWHRRGEERGGKPATAGPAPRAMHRGREGGGGRQRQQRKRRRNTKARPFPSPHLFLETSLRAIPCAATRRGKSGREETRDGSEAYQRQCSIRGTEKNKNMQTYPPKKKAKRVPDVSKVRGSGGGRTRRHMSRAPPALLRLWYRPP